MDDTSVSETSPLNAFFHGSDDRDPGSRDSANPSPGDVIHELSVAPSGVVQYPDDRPAWIDSKATTVDGAPRFVAKSNPSASSVAAKDLCRVEVDALIRRHAATLVRDFHDPHRLKLSSDWIDEAVVRQTYAGTVDLVDGETLHEAAALLVFDEDVDAYLRLQIQQVMVRERLVGLGAVTTVGLLGLILGTTILGIVSRRVERKSHGGA